MQSQSGQEIFAVSEQSRLANGPFVCNGCRGSFFPGSKVLRLTMSGAIPLLPVYACKAWTGRTLLLSLCLSLPLPYANGHTRKLKQQHSSGSIPVTERKSKWCCV
jgi:hypothetical protein